MEFPEDLCCPSCSFLSCLIIKFISSKICFCYVINYHLIWSRSSIVSLCLFFTFLSLLWAVDFILKFDKLCFLWRDATYLSIPHCLLSSWVLIVLTWGSCFDYWDRHISFSCKNGVFFFFFFLIGLGWMSWLLSWNLGTVAGRRYLLTLSCCTTYLWKVVNGFEWDIMMIWYQLMAS